MLSFRTFTSGDFALMFRWLGADHVKEWWDDSEDTLEKVIEHYGTGGDDAEKFVLLDGEKPLGYFQYYFADENTIGIDQFIGEKEYINRGVGTKAVELFVEMIAGKHLASFIILDPSPDNKRAIRCYEKAGFEYYETVTHANGAPAYMMRLKCG